MVKEKVYFYRGQIERVTSRGQGRWTEGYSGVGAAGGVLYPWNTKRECQREARDEGKVARFVRKS